MNLFTVIFLAALIASLVIRLWLSSRQVDYVRAHRDTVPGPFRERISLDAHRRAADYTVAHTRVGQVESAFDALVLLAWTLGGGLWALDAAWRELALTPLATGVGMIVSVFLIIGLLDLPFSLYRTFRIEQAFGFNRMTPRLFVVDTLKQTILLLALGTPLAAVVLWLMQSAGTWWWLYAWGVWMAFTLALIWAYPRIIAPWFNSFSPVEDTELRERIERLLAQCGFTSRGVYVMDNSKRSAHGNAYFTGVGQNKRIVFFDTLLDTLEPVEVEAVLAHELGHFRLQHVRKRLIMSAVFSLIGLGLLGWLMGQSWFYNGLGVPVASTHAALMLFLLVVPVFTFFLQPIMSRLSRRHEFEADEFAVTHSDGRALARALVKLYEENATTLTPDPLYSGFYDSHPPALQRLNRLTEGNAPKAQEAMS